MEKWIYRTDRIFPVDGSIVIETIAEAAHRLGFKETEDPSRPSMVRRQPVAGTNMTDHSVLHLSASNLYASQLQLVLQRSRYTEGASTPVGPADGKEAILWRASSEVWLDRIWEAVAVRAAQSGIGIISAELDRFYPTNPETVARAFMEYYRGHFRNSSSHAEFSHIIPNTNGEQFFHGEAVCTKATAGVTHAHIRVVAHMRADNLNKQTLAAYTARFRQVIERDITVVERRFAASVDIGQLGRENGIPLPF